MDGRIFRTIALAGALAAPGSTVVAAEGGAPAQPEDIAAACAKAGDDDTIRGYAPDLEARTASAFKKLFPKTRVEPPADALETQAQYRCMGGKAMVCFVGANLPCGKLDPSRENAGADAFCREQPDADQVPAAAVGHDAAYAFRCRGERGEAVGEQVPIDARGFAKDNWTELPDR